MKSSTLKNTYIEYLSIFIIYLGVNFEARRCDNVRSGSE